MTHNSAPQSLNTDTHNPERDSTDSRGFEIFRLR